MPPTPGLHFRDLSSCTDSNLGRTLETEQNQIGLERVAMVEERKVYGHATYPYVQYICTASQWYVTRLLSRFECISQDQFNVGLPLTMNTIKALTESTDQLRAMLDEALSARAAAEKKVR